MKTAAKPTIGDKQTIQMLPRWVTSLQGQTLDTVAFTSGAALAMLDVVLGDPSDTLPGALLRDRLALDAAVACLKLENRNESAADLRDAVCLARTWEALGPAGDMFMAWRKLARINLKASGWKDRVGKLLPANLVQAVLNIDDFTGTPVARASRVLTDVLREFPREEAAALMIADATLARVIGWGRVMPLLAAQLPRKDIRNIAVGEDDPELCVHRAMVAACDGAVRSAANLNRRTAKLHAIAPKLRANGSDEALNLFLSYDAVSPSGMLSPMIKDTSTPMTDRAARRLCDRLVALGVVRELTGRATFRLYGV